MQALTNKTISTATETVTSPLTAAEAAYSRDSLAKSLYGRLFDWVVIRANDLMYKADHEGFVIGVLDIYGFEIFDRNSFEQLCINFCNEKLHQVDFIYLFILIFRNDNKKDLYRADPQGRARRVPQGKHQVGRRVVLQQQALR